MTRRVIVLEDDESLRLVITKALSRAGFEVRATASPETAIERMARHEADALVADVLLGRDNFLDRIGEVRQLRPDAPILVMSAQTTAGTALKADSAGAFEYLPKPFDINDLVDTLNRSLERKPPQRSSGEVTAEPELLGKSSVMQTAFKAIARLTRSHVPVLITGPDGSGRASAARVIHKRGMIDGPLVEAGPRQLDSEPAKLWAAAEGGSLLLRRADDWSADSQKFIREMLESKGGNNVRLLTTGSEQVADVLPRGLLDLMSVGHIEIPPVFQRSGDRALLFDSFLQAAGAGFSLSQDAIDFVNSQVWPGEVLQLKRTAQHIAAQGQPGKVEASTVAAAMVGPMHHDPAEELELAGIRYFAASDAQDASDLATAAIMHLECGMIKAALEASGGVRQEAAKRLGMNRNTFSRKIDQYDLDVGD